MASTFTIASGASLSDAVDLGNVLATSELIGIVMPSAWTAGNLTFQVSIDDDGGSGTYQNLYQSDGTEATVTAAASRTISFTADMRATLKVWRWVKIRSGTSGTPVTQGAARTIQIIVK